MAKKVKVKLTVAEANQVIEGLELLIKTKRNSLEEEPIRDIIARIQTTDVYLRAAGIMGV